MPIFNNIDAGLSIRNRGPEAGQEAGTQLVEGQGLISWPHGNRVRQRLSVGNVQAPFAIGGQTAYSKAATALVVQQLVELANNPNLQPVYIQWSSGNGTTVVNSFDGWYILNDVTPLEWYWNNHVPCQVTATWVSPLAPHRYSMSYSGGALSTNFTGGALNLISLPSGSTATEASFLRTGGEGSIPCILSPIGSPQSFVPSAPPTLFQGAVHVYDSIA